jgi:uncharacterized OB-fold protein
MALGVTDPNDGNVGIRALRCGSCGVTVHRGGNRCIVCGSESNVSPIEVRGEGKVDAWTRVGDVAFGEVRLVEGLLVFGRLEVDNPYVGAPVKALTVTGEEVVCFGPA